jgi:hypothetical protein
VVVGARDLGEAVARALAGPDPRDRTVRAGERDGQPRLRRRVRPDRAADDGEEYRQTSEGDAEAYEAN